MFHHSDYNSLEALAKQSLDKQLEDDEQMRFVSNWDRMHRVAANIKPKVKQKHKMTISELMDESMRRDRQRAILTEIASAAIMIAVIPAAFYFAEWVSHTEFFYDVAQSFWHAIK